MSTFFYADGRIEEHDTPPGTLRWRIAQEAVLTMGFLEYLDTCGPLDPYMTIPVVSFEMVHFGVYVEVQPDRFSCEAIKWWGEVEYKDLMTVSLVPQGVLAAEELRRRMLPELATNSPAGRVWISPVYLRDLPGVFDQRIARGSQVMFTYPLRPCEATAAPEVIEDE